jgi:hypothetical protein
MNQLNAIRVFVILAAASLPLMAAKSGTLATVNAADAARFATDYVSPSSGVAMWIWSDKYVYEPGQSLTLRWTVKTNNDLYPYTIVAYRQNNQNGRRYYLPQGSEEPADIFRNTVAQGFQPARVSAADRQVLLGANGLLGGAATIPNEPGMHTLVVQLRDYTGTRVLKSAYMKIGVVTGFEDLQGNIDSNRTLVNTRAYRLRGVVLVRNNAVLTVEPGTFIFGQPGSQPPSVLVVTKNGRIEANGTRSRPIVMTSSQAFGNRQRGDWGGLILLGRAPVNVGANTSTGNAAGEFFIEGLPATEETKYGGSDANHNCGTLRYVRVEYAGAILSPNNETNSFTWGGCGKGTVSEYLQAHYGLDDAFEWFGGTADAKYLVAGLHADDFVDFQLGYTGRVQFGVFYQSNDARGNRGLEGDNSEYDQAALPRSNPVMYNLTFFGSGAPGFDEANAPGLYLRRGSAGSFNNMIVSNFSSTGIQVDGASTLGQVDANALTMNGILLWRNGLATNAPNTLQGQVEANTLSFAQGTRGTGRNFVVADPILRRPSELSDPDWMPGFGSPVYRATWIAPPDDGFFDQSANFIGAFGTVNWTEEWVSWLQEEDVRAQ